MKRKIFLLYPYYWPHYKAGGPVQSLFNLVSLFSEQCDFYLIALEKDLDGLPSEKLIHSNAWVKGPNQENVFYTDSFTPWFVYKLVKQVKPDVVLLNGMFNIHTTLNGLLAAKLLGIKVIISPRGMLQAWALKRSATIKKIMMLFFKILLKKNEVWHATDAQEKSDITFHFGAEQRVFEASNIPRKVSSFRPLPFPDEKGKIKIVFLSLINSNKNLHLIIDAVNQCPEYVLDIYGPVIDQAYWDLCKTKILDTSSVFYKGPIPPWDVPDVLSQYHFFVLPTQGENFGHAIFDALSVGVPILISKKTPWQNIEEKGAGFYIVLEDEESLPSILKQVSKWSDEDYAALRNRSMQYAIDYWHKTDFKKDYSFLIDE